MLTPDRGRLSAAGTSSGTAAVVLHGFQLWANLPSSLKMTTPRYQDVPARDIPEVVDDDGTKVRVICGSFWGKTGPIDGVAADPRYLDVSVPPGTTRRLAVETPRHAFAYVFAGSGRFHDASQPRPVRTEQVGDVETPGEEPVGNRSLVLFDGGDEIAGRRRGDPLSEGADQEPVASHPEQLHQAFTELRQGTFVKERGLHALTESRPGPSPDYS